MKPSRVVVAALLAMPAIASACVNTVNGALCEQYKDVELTAHGHSLSLERRYNSGRAAQNGWFGHGWGTIYETRLTVTADGSVRMDDPGNGVEENYAAPDLLNRQAVSEEAITRQDKEMIALDAGAWLRSKPERDRENASLLEIGRQYGVNYVLRDGAKLRSALCERGFVTRINEVYRRVSCSGEVDEFDLAGRMLSHMADGYRMSLHYAGARPDLIADSAGQQLLLNWDAEGHIAEVRTGNAESVATYRYASGDLVAASVPADTSESADGARREYRYSYDAQHRMTESGTEGMPTVKVGYDAAGRVNETQGNVVERYEYRADPDQPELHFWATRISDANAEPAVILREAEYFLERDSTGKPVLRRVVKTVQTEGGPKELIEEILLDEHERIVSLHRANGEFADYRYDLRYGKVGSVTTGEGRREYRYDARGQMVEAKDSDGRRIRLSYDRQSHIVRMVERHPGERRKVLTFGYNADGKPVRISMVGKGEIRVKYDARGEIAKVSSNRGAKMALAVTQAFQSLLTLVKSPSASLCP